MVPQVVVVTGVVLLDAVRGVGASLKWCKYAARICRKWRSFRIQSSNSRHSVPIILSQIAFARGAWGGLV
jgi:hypothetical protein